MAYSKYYLTTPVFDASFAPNIGSLYTAILGDAIARHRRMCGYDVAFWMGTDTHRASDADTSQNSKAGETDSIDANDRKFSELLRLAGVHNTLFQHAYSREHARAVDALLRRILRRSHLSIYKGPYQGRRCAHDQIDVSDSAQPANCEICGRAAELINEERYFFRLSSFQGRLTALYKSRQQFVQPAWRFEEIKRFVAGGLSDIPISCRRANGGIPWPDDPDHKVNERCAELACYLSGVGFGQTESGADEFAKYWPANAHVVSSAALRRHAVFWPAFLMAADLSLPWRICAHGTISLEPGEAEASFLSDSSLRALEGDALRYYLLLKAGDGGDVRVSSSGLAHCSRKDLDEGLVRLANQILTLVARDYHGKIPARSLLSSIEPTIEIMAADIRAEVRFLLDSFNFSDGLKKIWSFMETIDGLLKSTASFERATGAREKQRFTDVLSDACEGLGLITLLLHPILPATTDAIWRSLGQTTRLEDQLVDETPWNSLRPGTSIGKFEGLFHGVGKLQRAASAKRETNPGS
jgi:methionyl-tRNA synthetase